MKENQNALSDILSLTGIFRLEKNRWPLHAAELQGFALELNRSLDFRGFHRFRFNALSPNEVVLDFWIQTARPEWAKPSQARVTLEPRGYTSDDTLPLVVSLEHFPPQKVETKNYCLV